MAKEYPLLIGHCYRGHKRLRSINDVADFIMKHGKYGGVNVTFENGKFFLDTYGIYINKIVDQEYREELLKVLVQCRRLFLMWMMIPKILMRIPILTLKWRCNFELL